MLPLSTVPCSEPVLVTGAAGFIGFHTCRALLQRGDRVLGVDNCNDYYSPKLKSDRLDQLRCHQHFRFHELDLADRAGTAAFFAQEHFGAVVHLAAQAGVRYSIRNPSAYIDSNLVAFGNVLEGCRQRNTPHLLYGSSSSVYGANRKLPFAESDPVDHPVSLYAATKKANELMAHTYSHLHGLPATGLRFFTVYGPWGRPDMACWTFTRKIIAGEPVALYNHGRMQRDFTYVDDVVDSVIRLLDRPPRPQAKPVATAGTAATTEAPWRVLNIGNHRPVALLDFVSTLEAVIGKPAHTVLMPMQPGDVEATCADVSALKAIVDVEPRTPLDCGLKHFVSWYRNYHNR